MALADDSATGTASKPSIPALPAEERAQEHLTPLSAAAGGVPAAAAGPTTNEALTEAAGDVFATPSHEPANSEAAAQLVAPTVEKPLVVAIEDLSTSGSDKEEPGPAVGKSLPGAAEASTVATPMVDIGGPVAGVVTAMSKAESEVTEAVAVQLAPGADEAPMVAQDTNEAEQPKFTAELEGVPEAANAIIVDVAAGMAESSECGSAEEGLEVVMSGTCPNTDVVEDECEDLRAAGQEARINVDAEGSGKASPTPATTLENTTENTPITTVVDGKSAADEGLSFAAIMPTASEGVSDTTDTEQVASEATAGEQEVEHPTSVVSEVDEASVADVGLALLGSSEDEVSRAATS